MSHHTANSGRPLDWTHDPSPSDWDPIAVSYPRESRDEKAPLTPDQIFAPPIRMDPPGQLKQSLPEALPRMPPPRPTSGPNRIPEPVLLESAPMGNTTPIPRDVQQLLSLPPPRLWKEMGDFKWKHIQSARASWGHYICANEHALEWLSHCMHGINGLNKSSWPAHRQMQIAFLPGALKALYRGFDNWHEGFYDEAGVAMRSAFEALFKIVFLSCYPKDHLAVLVRKLPKGHRRFNLTEFMRNDLNIDWLFLWQLNSGMIHGNMHRALKHVVNAVDKKDHLVSLGFAYDDEAITIPMNQSTFLSWCYLRLLKVLFPDLVERAKPEARETLRLIDSGIRQLMEGTPQNRFPGAIQDMLRMEATIAAAGRGEDWRAVAAAQAPTVQAGADQKT